jgi:hypothetical protein
MQARVNAESALVSANIFLIILVVAIFFYCSSKPKLIHA